MPTAAVANTIDNNVYTEAVALGTAYGWGVDVLGGVYHGSYYNLGTLNFSNNIMTHTHTDIWIWYLDRPWIYCNSFQQHLF